MNASTSPKSSSLWQKWDKSFAVFCNPFVVKGFLFVNTKKPLFAEGVTGDEKD